MTAVRSPAAGTSHARASAARSSAVGASPARTAAAAWSLSGAVFLALCAALTSFGVLFGEGAWVTSTLLVAAVGIIAGTAARQAVRAWTLAWSLLAGAGAVLVSVTILFAADTALLGVVPLFGTVDRFSALIAEGELSIAEQAVPAFADEGIRFLMAVGVGLVAVVADAVVGATRSPALVAIPLLGILAVPVILVPGALPLLSVLLTAAAFLLVLALHRPASSGGRAGVGRVAGSIAVVLGIALIAPSLLPGVVAGATAGGTGPAGLVTGVNPVLELGDDLRRSNPVEALRYSTEVDGGLYLTLSHLDDFAGQQVLPVEIDAAPQSAGDLQPPRWLPEGVEAQTVTSQIGLSSIRSQWLPLPSAPASVQGVPGEWVIDPDGITMRVPSGVVRDLDYAVTSSVLLPSEEQLRGAGVGAEGLEAFRQLPEGLDPSIREAALEATAEATNPYEQALELQRFFTGGLFTYSEIAPVEGGYDGTGADIVAQFLIERSGYCVHYASAMALMARTLDIPARIAVGFLPGVRNPQVPTEFIVSSDNLHAWPELHFDGLGWVRFEPTPSRGTTPEYAADTVPVGDDVPTTTDPDDPDPAQSDEPDPADSAAPDADGDGPTNIPDLVDGGVGADGEGAGSGGVFADPVVRSSLLVVAVVLLLGALLAAPGVWRALRRRRRMRSADPLDLWREVRDTARDLGLPAEATATPRALARVWSDREQPGTSAAVELDALRHALEQRAYADPLTERQGGASIAPILVGLRRSVPLPWRVLARLAPLSLTDVEPDDARVEVEQLTARAPA